MEKKLSKTPTLPTKMHKSGLYIFLSLTLFVAFSCGRPSNVLKEKEMVDLMVDMEIAEAYVNTQNNLTYHDREDIGKRVLEAHGVSEETLDTTLAWYGRNMDEYSELFEKVDKEINRRRKKYTEIPGQKLKETDNIWTFGDHVVISPLSGQDAFTFSIPRPALEKGNLVKLSLYLPNSTNLKGTLGVEYTDGSGESTMTNFTRNSVKMEIQTDSSKTVSRLFGIMHLKDTKNLPLYIDSISIKGEPLDTTEYKSKRRMQKGFGAF